MSSYLLPYTAGTISLENGSKVVTGVGTAFQIEVMPGDLLQAPDGGFYALGAAAITNTGFELVDDYAGTTVAGAPYKIHRFGPGHGDVSNLNVRLAEIFTAVQQGYAMRSLTPVEIGAGEHVFTVPSAMPILPGARLLFSSSANPDTHWILGLVSAYAGQAMTIEALEWDGEGDTRGDWNINLAGNAGPRGFSAYQVAVAEGFVGDEAAWLASLNGSDGDNGWTPELAVVSDGARRVQQVVDWFGGEDTKPATGLYVGASGLVSDIGDAQDIRGPAGTGDGDVAGPDGGVVNNEVALFDGTTGKLLKGGGVTVAGIISAAVDAVRAGVDGALDTLAEIATAIGSLAASVANKLPKDGSEAMTGPLVLTEDDAPATPASGTLAIYAKADGKIYRKDDAGVEAELGAGSGGEPDDYDVLKATLGFMAMQLADVINFAQFPSQDRFADSFDDLTYVDVAGATNLDTSTPGLLKPTTTAGSDQTATHTGATQSGNTVSASSFLASGGGFPGWKAFDKVTTSGSDAAGDWITNSTTTGWLQYQFGSARTIASYTLKAPHSSLLARCARSWTLLGSNTGSFSGEEVTLDTRTNITFTGGQQQSFNISSPASFTYYRLNITANNGDATFVEVTEVTLLTAGAVSDATVRTAALPLAGTPEIMSGLLLVREVDAVTVNTDLMLDFSRNNGTNWISAALTLIRTVPIAGGVTLKLYGTDHIDMTAHSFNTACRARMRSANSKMVEFQGLFVYGA